MLQILDLTRQYATLKPQVDAAVLKVMETGQFILGPTVQTFEDEAARYLDTAHAIGCASGTDALYLALRALNIGPGDEVITTAFSYIATSEAIARTGATPVFVDIDPTTYNIDPQLISEKITPKTKALLPVHLYGQPADMDAIMGIAKTHGLKVIEDCAQSMGAEWNGQKVGTFGDFGCYSFFPTKNLGCYGDGGMVSTNSDDLNEKVRMLRVHGSRTRYDHETEGINSRLDAIQAAVLRVKLPYLDGWNQQRQVIAKRYNEAFSRLSDITVPPLATDSATPIFHQYTLRVPARDAFQKALADVGIQTMIYYPKPLHVQGMHKSLGYQHGDLPLTEAAAAQVLSLPIFPELTDTEIQHVITSVTTALKNLAQGVSGY